MDEQLSLKSLPVFYTSKMVADAQSYSPSAAKPSIVVAAWQSLGLPLTVMEPQLKWGVIRTVTRRTRAHE